jgi:site-specific recombinase XerD
VPYDSRKCAILYVMQENQLPLFNQKKYTGVMASPLTIELPTPDSTVPMTLLAYETYLKSGNYSKYTPADFTGDIRKFGKYIKDRKRLGFPMGEKKLKDIRTGDIQQWIGELRKIMTRKTVSRKVSALNNYFLWLESQRILTNNPMQGIAPIRETSPLPDVLFEEERKRLLATASVDPRSYLLFSLFLDTGITLEELLALKVQHFDFSNAYASEMLVKHRGTKEHKERKLKLPVETKAVFTEYCTKYMISEKLFPRSDRWIRLLITDITQRAGVKKRVSPQILRDSCAVRWLKNGEPLETVLKKLGLKPDVDDDAGRKYTKLISEAL